MALDFMAIISHGTYPTVATTTVTERAIFAVSWGLLALAAAAVGGVGNGLNRFGFGTKMN